MFGRLDNKLAPLWITYFLPLCLSRERRRHARIIRAAVSDGNNSMIAGEPLGVGWLSSWWRGAKRSNESPAEGSRSPRLACDRASTLNSEEPALVKSCNRQSWDCPGLPHGPRSPEEAFAGTLDIPAAFLFLSPASVFHFTTFQYARSLNFPFAGGNNSRKRAEERRVVPSRTINFPPPNPQPPPPLATAVQRRLPPEKSRHPRRGSREGNAHATGSASTFTTYSMFPRLVSSVSSDTENDRRTR